MTKQETFDRVVAHLRAQGRRSQWVQDGYTVCRYRTPEGLQCAAGCLIPDERYSEDLEGNGVETLMEFFTELGHDVKLVAHLQEVHDFNPPEKWETALFRVADQFHLQYTPREEAVS